MIIFVSLFLILFVLSMPKTNAWTPISYASHIFNSQNQIQNNNATTSPDTEHITNCPWVFDICSGTGAKDKMIGSSQADYIFSGGGDDYIMGGNGSDYLNGGEGKDMIYGEGGADTIEGANGEDKMDGGLGNDIIFSGQEKDEILPGHVNSTEFPPSKDYIDCGDGYDSIYVDSSDVYKNCEVVNGTIVTMTTSRISGN